MKGVHYGVISTMGALVGVLLVLVAVHPPTGQTSAPRARFAPIFQTDAGGFGLPGQMIGVTFEGRALTAASLTEDVAGMKYDLDLIGSGGAEVPRLFLANFPSDLETLSDDGARKGIFLKIVLPLVLYANEEILADRERLWRIRYQARRGEGLSSLDRLWLIIKAEQYRVAPGDIDELARRLDIVPPSLALAQAALESGWGTSTLVRQQNALFGQPLTVTPRTMSVNSTGLTVGMTDEAGNFGTLLESVRAYVHNLNIHPAYEEFRRSRAGMRSQGTPLDGASLVSDLGSGSQRRGDGIGTLRAIIEANGLRRLDDARLQYGPDTSEPAA